MSDFKAEIHQIRFRLGLGRGGKDMHPEAKPKVWATGVVEIYFFK